jgi:hypothetical protein
MTTTTLRLKRFVQGLEEAWEDFIFDRCTELPTLFEIDNIDAKWLSLQRPLLAFTRDLSFDCTTEELRRILTNAVKFWNDKPSEEGVVNDAVRMVTGNRFRAAGYFDFRMQVDQTVITEELEDFDPNVIDFPGQKLIGLDLRYGVIVGEGVGSFVLIDLPTDIFPGGVFGPSDHVGWLAITKDTAQPSNEGIYRVDSLNPGSAVGYIFPLGTPFPAPHSGTDIEWELYGYQDDFITEVRIVDQGFGTLEYDEQSANFTVTDTVRGSTSDAQGVITADDDRGTEGTLSLRSIRGRFEDGETIVDDSGGTAKVKGKLQGVLNRSLLAFLMNIARPNGERLDIVYINFLDQFIQPSDLDQWAITPTGGVTVPSPGGAAEFDASARLIDADSQSSFWGDQVVAWKFEAGTSTTVVELTFFVTDASNHYFVRADYANKEIKLYRKVVSVDTQIGSTVSYPVMKAGVQDVIRVDAVAEGSDTRIRVKVNSDTLIDAVDSPASFTAGGVGAYAATSTFKLKLVEVNVIPTEIDRVGPNP